MWKQLVEAVRRRRYRGRADLLSEVFEMGYRAGSLDALAAAVDDTVDGAN